MHLSKTDQDFMGKISEGSRIIGIMGGIGSGKSVVSRILRCNGFMVYDCDFEAKTLMNKDKILKEKIIINFGIQSYLPTGDINRSFLSDLIFCSEEKRLLLNSLVHKAVKDDIIKHFFSLGKIIFIESAILIESGIYEFCDEVWSVEAPERLKIERVKERNGFSEDKIRSILNSQKSTFTEKKNSRISFIDNDGFHSLILRIHELMGQEKLSQNYEYSI